MAGCQKFVHLARETPTASAASTGVDGCRGHSSYFAPVVHDLNGEPTPSRIEVHASSPHEPVGAANASWRALLPRASLLHPLVDPVHERGHRHAEAATDLQARKFARRDQFIRLGSADAEALADLSRSETQSIVVPKIRLYPMLPVLTL